VGISAFASSSLPEPETFAETIELDQLIAAWSNPGKFFCETLGIRLKLSDLTVEDIEPQFIDRLTSYQIRDRMLQLFLEGDSENHVWDTLRLEGSLPAGELGRVTFEGYRQKVTALLQQVERFGERSPVAIELEVAGRRLIGSVPHVTREASLHFRPAKLTAKDRISAWIHHLALAASGEQKPTLLIGSEEMQILEPVNDPLRFLEPLVARYEELRCEPRLLFPLSSMNYAEKHSYANALTGFDGSNWNRGDCDDHYVAFLNRHHHPIKDRFEDFAREAEALWTPINAHLKKA
jgi:exodeoxyribonuclease V gamma subunit